LGALLYELLVGLPPYYSRNQNELFNNILSKELEFPPGLDLSKDLKKMLQRLLEKDTDLRFKKVSDIFSHPWLKDVKMEDVLGKKMDPPFKTSLF
jgi:serum/glucocorticoid-regulated kinase 2